MGPIAAELKATEATVEWAHDSLGLSYGEISELLGATRRTVSRWRSREFAPSPRHREGIEKLRVLRHLLESVFEDEETAAAWLYGSVPMLEGRSPIGLLRRGDMDPVIETLAGLESGAYA